MKKRAKCIDMEKIIMGEELCDIEINYAQYLWRSNLKKLIVWYQHCTKTKSFNWLNLRSKTNSRSLRKAALGSRDNVELSAWWSVSLWFFVSVLWLWQGNRTYHSQLFPVWFREAQDYRCTVPKTKGRDWLWCLCHSFCDSSCIWNKP